MADPAVSNPARGDRLSDVAPRFLSDPATPRYVVRVLASPALGPDGIDHVELFPGQSVMLGRGEEASLVLRDGRVSREHLRLDLDEDATRVFARDTSANGTTLNGRPLRQGVIEDGDVLRLGDSLVIVRLDAGEERDGDVPSLIGSAPSMRRLRHAVVELARETTPILLLGETGTGRERTARAIHAAAGRRGPFVVFDCAATTPDPERALLGGDAEQGALAASRGGTLFLEDLAALSTSLQAELVRALDTATEELFVIAASDEELAEEVREGTFRDDLHARLSHRVLATPPLRERREDILPILVAALGEEAPPIAPDLLEALLSHRWPFNLRELRKVGRELRLRALDAERLELSLVSSRLKRRAEAFETEQTMELPCGAAAYVAPARAAPAPRQEEELPPPSKERLVELLTTSKGNISLVSRETRRSRRQVYRYLEEHGLSLDDFRDAAP